MRHKIIDSIRDKWRGYSDKDMESALNKRADAGPCGIVWLSQAELAGLVAYDKRPKCRFIAEAKGDYSLPDTITWINHV